MQQALFTSQISFPVLCDPVGQKTYKIIHVATPTSSGQEEELQSPEIKIATRSHFRAQRNKREVSE